MTFKYLNLVTKQIINVVSVDDIIVCIIVKQYLIEAFCITLKVILFLQMSLIVIITIIFINYRH